MSHDRSKDYKKCIDSEKEKQKRLDESQRNRKAKSEKKLMEKRMSSQILESNGGLNTEAEQEGNWEYMEEEKVEDKGKDELSTGYGGLEKEEDQDSIWGDKEEEKEGDKGKEGLGKEAEAVVEDSMDPLVMKNIWSMQHNRVEDSAPEEVKWNYILNALLGSESMHGQSTAAFTFIKKVFGDFKKGIASLQKDIDTKEQTLKEDFLKLKGELECLKNELVVKDQTISELRKEVDDLRKDVDKQRSPLQASNWSEVAQLPNIEVRETNRRETISSSALIHNPALNRKNEQNNRRIKSNKKKKLSADEINELVQSSAYPSENSSVYPSVNNARGYEGKEIIKVSCLLPLPANVKVDYASKREIWTQKMVKLAVDTDTMLRRNSSIYGNKVDVFAYGHKVKELQERLKKDGLKIINLQEEPTAPNEYVKLHKERQLSVLKQTAFRIANLLAVTKDTFLRDAITDEMHVDIIQEALNLETQIRNKAGKFSYDPHGF